jgi:hypothetical protein
VAEVLGAPQRFLGRCKRCSYRICRQDAWSFDGGAGLRRRPGAATANWRRDLQQPGEESEIVDFRRLIKIPLVDEAPLIYKLASSRRRPAAGQPLRTGNRAGPQLKRRAQRDVRRESHFQQRYNRVSI